MIVDEIANFAQYLAIHPSFAKAFEFLQENNLVELKPGRHEIDGDKIFALVSEVDGREKEGAILEFHRNFIDIQLCTFGIDYIGYSPLEECSDLKEAYNPDNDCGFFADSAKSWCCVGKNDFAIFFPNDAHAPLGGNGKLTKIVIKIAVNISQ